MLISEQKAFQEHREKLFLSKQQARLEVANLIKQIKLNQNYDTPIVVGEILSLHGFMFEKVNRKLTLTFTNNNPDAIVTKHEGIEIKVNAGSSSYCRRINNDGIVEFILPKGKEFKLEATT